MGDSRPGRPAANGEWRGGSGVVVVVVVAGGWGVSEGSLQRSDL